MKSTILLRDEINLSSMHRKMISSGWGAEAVENTVCEKITYLSDGLKVNGYIAYPKDRTQKYPCIIWNRGGYGENGAIDEFNACGIFGQMASWGYVVFASQYRGNNGGEEKDEFGGSDVNDVLNLIPLADEFEFANKNIWGIEGWSRGGMMTYLTLTKSDLFKAAIVSGAIANLHCESEEFRNILLKAFPQSSDEEIAEMCHSRSILNFPERLCPTTPLLILHGTGDDKVPYQDSESLSKKLAMLNREHKLVLYENGDHFLKAYRKEVDKLRKEWFDNYLK